MNETGKKNIDVRELLVILVVGLIASVVFLEWFDIKTGYRLAFFISLPVVLFAVAKGFRHGALAAVIGAAIYGTKLLYGQLFQSGLGESLLRNELINITVIVGSGFVVGLVMEFLHFRRSEPFREEATIVETFVPDEETGLYNFKSFRWMLRGEMRRVKRYNTPLSLIFLKIVNLDSFQKRYDYQQEIMLFREIGQLFRGMLREADYVGKYSDNEIGVVLPETGIAGVNVVCARLEERIADLRVHVKKKWDEINLEFEYSRANYPKDAGNLEELIDVVDSRYQQLK
ncbi:MAG: diguanylate cyclase [Myxococcales bacterium]|nr:diguanylate cyclase [Myxococcales bacterium]